MSDVSRLLARVDELSARAERAEAALERTQMGQHVFLERARRAEAAIQRARDLAAFWQHAATSGSAAWLAGELLAALDSTDPVEAAPEEPTFAKKVARVAMAMDTRLDSAQLGQQWQAAMRGAPITEGDPK